MQYADGVACNLRRLDDDIPLLPDAWAADAAEFPILTFSFGFLMKEVLFLPASFYLFEQDLGRAALDIEPSQVLRRAGTLWTEV